MQLDGFAHCVYRCTVFHILNHIFISFDQPLFLISDLNLNVTFKHLIPQLFYSFFKSLVGKDVVVELKNDLR